jgi:hypothetical protein
MDEQSAFLTARSYTDQKKLYIGTYPNWFLNFKN